MAADAAISLRETKDKPSIQSFDPLNLIQREEQLVRKKERLPREEKKKENPSMTIEKAMDDWLNQQYKRVQAGAFAENSYEHKKNCSRHVRFSKTLYINFFLEFIND